MDQNITTSKIRIERNRHLHHENAKYFKIKKTGEKKQAGSAMIYRQPNHPHIVEIGISVSRQFQNQGIATQAIPMLEQQAKKYYKAKRIELRITPLNYPSIAVAKKLGYTMESFARLGCFWKGQAQDCLIFVKA